MQLSLMLIVLHLLSTTMAFSNFAHLPRRTQPALTRVFSSGGRSSASVAKASSKSSTPTATLSTAPVKGTRDMYPEDMRLRIWLFNHFRAAAASHNFVEYDSPVLESTELYIRKAGDEVTSQLYAFEDQGKRSVSLRPEMTPSLARMVMAKGKGMNLPIKYYSIPQCWRYERMTRGRRREHYQWNMDVWGVEGVSAEAELLSSMCDFFTRVGLTPEDVGIKINSRGIVAEVLQSLNIPDEAFAATCVIIDKLDKIPLDALKDDLAALGISLETATQLTEILSAKSLDAMAASLPPSSPALKTLTELFSFLDAYGLSDWVVFDASVIRGLSYVRERAYLNCNSWECSYYTGAVFEAFDRRGELRAIAGGGRYDTLLESFGGVPTPAVGFGLGDAVIVELLKDLDLLPPTDQGSVDCVVYAMDEELVPSVLKVARSLRADGMSVDAILEPKKLKWVFKQADKIGAGYVIIVGSDEWARGEVGVKNLATGEQSCVKLEAIGEYFKQ